MSEEILSELQLLSSMYSPSDIHFDDPETVLKIENSIPIPGSVSLSVKLNELLKISVRIPSGYPQLERLSASCHFSKSKSDSFKREGVLNGKLTEYLKAEGVNVLGLISWCNEQWEDLLENEDVNAIDVDASQSSSAERNKICRIWIHSHHIYNEKKRKFIVDNASSLDLKGFSLPGKPGFICVEGDPKNCDEFWSRIRQLTWQKISLIERQDKEKGDRAFTNFEELLIDKSTFMKYLTEKNIQNVIKDYLGF